MFDTPSATVLLAANDQLLGARIAADEQWRFPPLRVVSEKFRYALIQFEDRRFAFHPGIDPLAIIRALIGNIRAGRTLSGGSTLTMQLARLSRRNPPHNPYAPYAPPRTYQEKLIEMLFALKLEWHYSKAELLALYASHAPFGGNIVGVSAAAWRYFGRTVQDLTWAEAALLAVLPNRPGLIHPGRQRGTLLAKRNRLLTRLHSVGVLDALDYQLAMLEPLPARPRALPQHAPHLLQTLHRQQPGRSILRTTIDFPLQQAMNRIVAQHSTRLTARGIHNLALVVIDNRSFCTVAYVGNHISKISQLVPENASYVDIVHRPRSTGSILKPVLYALMLEAGQILPSTLIPDIPTQYAGYTPENYDRGYRGAVRAKDALARSLNIPAVRMLHRCGVDRFHDRLGGLGLSTLFRPAKDYSLSLILGGAEATLWDLTTLYANLAAVARDGAEQPSFRQPRLLRDVSRISAQRASISQGAAWLTLEALTDVTRPAQDSFWRNFSSSQHIAWKTGTSFGLRDGWAIGSNTQYTVGVWTGNASGKGAAGLTGLHAAAPILFDVFSHLGPAAWFPLPTAALKQVRVCRADGYLSNGLCEAEQTIHEWAPQDSHFEHPTPYHQRIHLDQTGQYRVHAGCESVMRMQPRSWFVLPPSLEFFHRRHQPDYQPLPPFRQDCLSNSSSLASQSDMEVLYPHDGTHVYIPLDLDGHFSRTVFRAVHRDPHQVLYWHIDETYMGATRHFHDLALYLNPGWHTLIVIDAQGNRATRRFRVLSQSRAEAKKRIQVSLGETP